MAFHAEPDPSMPLLAVPNLALITLEGELLLIPYRLLPVPCQASPNSAAPFLAAPLRAANTRSGTLKNALSTVSSSMPYLSLPSLTPPLLTVPILARPCLTLEGTLLRMFNRLFSAPANPRRGMQHPASAEPCRTRPYLYKFKQSVTIGNTLYPHTFMSCNIYFKENSKCQI